MKKVVSKWMEIIPGFVISIIIAFIARYLGSLLPIHIIGASVIALFIGVKTKFSF